MVEQGRLVGGGVTGDDRCGDRGFGRGGAVDPGGEDGLADRDRASGGAAEVGERPTDAVSAGAVVAGVVRGGADEQVCGFWQDASSQRWRMTTSAVRSR